MTRTASGQWMRRVFHGGLLLAWLLAGLALPAAAAPQFQTSLDRDTISLGETATLSMTFSGGSPRGQPNLSPIAGIRFGSTGYSQQSTFDGGHMTSSTIFTLELQPTRAGDFTIPALVAVVDGNRLASRPLRLRVLQGNIPQANGAPETAFVRIIPAATTVYLGQVIPVEVQCFCMGNVGNIQLPQLASDSFILGPMPTNPGRSQSQRANVAYNLFNFRVSATATRTGAQTLGPATWSMTVYLGQQTFFGWTGGQRPLTVTSDAPQINVVPIPTNGAPPTFNGAIGNFTLAQYEAGPASVGVGDPITLKITIAGNGSFDTVTLPADEQDWREFKTYPPTAKLTTSDPLQIQGSKYFEQVITPLNSEIKALPAFAFSYFDPTSGTFKTLTHAPIPLSVHTTAATAQPTVIATGATPPDAQPMNQEIVHIKPQPGALRRPAPPLVLQPFFLALQALPPLAWLGALMWRRQKDRLANNPRLRRRIEVARLIRERLAQLPVHAVANDAEQFHSTVLLLLREQLGERLDLPAPAITEAVLEQLNGLDAGTRALLRELFRACDQFRYAPDHSSQALASLIPNVKTALDALQKIPDAGPSAGRTLLQGTGILVLLLTVTATARAETDSFLLANKSYEEGKYSQAAVMYEDLLRVGRVSPAVYFNAGNAWFKAGQIGRAIYDYRRAVQLAPRDPDIRANLQIARARAASLPGSRWTRWVGRLTLDEWTCAAVAAAAMFFFLLTARQLSTALAKSTGGLAGLLAAVSVWLLMCLAIAIHQQLLEKSAVVLVSEAVVRRGPMEQSQSAFTARDGAELAVLTRVGDWLEVSDASRHIGWVQQKDVAQFP